MRMRKQRARRQEEEEDEERLMENFFLPEFAGLNVLHNSPTCL